MKIRRFLAAWLAGSLLLSLVGCAQTKSPADEEEPSTTTTSAEPAEGTGETSSTTAKQTVSAALCWDDTDTVNPYTAESRLNRRLTSLLYNGLTEVGADWEATPSLAASVTQVDATHLTVVLRSDAVFSDGSAVTAEDVSTSLKLAAQSDAYQALVTNIQSIAADTDDARTLTVTLKAADTVRAAASLSFPIVRISGQTVLGTGTYVINTKKSTLTANPQATTAPAITQWKLLSLASDRDRGFAVAAGQIALYFTDLTDGETPYIAGDVRQSTVTLNYLTFLGINSNRDKWADADFRAAISMAVSRSDLVSYAFSGYATAATTPFIPTWGAASGLSGADNEENVVQAVAKWKRLGYNVEKNGDQSSSATAQELPEAELLIPEGYSFSEAAARQIVAAMANVGLTVTVTALPYEQYCSRIKAKNFDWYLGEVRLSDDLSLRPWLTSGGSASYGVPAEAMTAYASYLAGELSLSEFNEAFWETVPFIPLVWRSGVAVYASSLSGPAPSGSDFYAGIETWQLS